MLGSVYWDDGLVQRHGHIGQLHCSYPAAFDFKDRIAPLDLLRAMRESRRADRPLSLAIQQPGGARMQADESAAYQSRLAREIEQLGCHVGQSQQLMQLQLSVGTLGIDALRRLVALLKTSFHFAEGGAASYTARIELAHADWPLIGALHELGFNQLSVGVPDLGADDGGTVAYFRSSARIRAVVEAAHALHYRAVNLDLGYGRSWQTPTSFARKLASIIELAPDQVTMFDYRDVTQAGGARLGLASLGDTLAMYRHGVEQLSAAGYRYIGLGKFVLPHDDLAMAQETGALHHDIAGYSLHGDCDHLGLGVGAVSRVGDLYCRNADTLHAYQRALDQGQLPSSCGLQPAHLDRLHRALFERLLCTFEVDFDALSRQSGVDVRQRYARHWPALRRLHAEGVIVLGESGLHIPPRARLLVAAVCEAFERFSAEVIGSSAGHGWQR
ncbi:coproporphyrinogen III oxidase [Pseudomonas stutzeri]|uniref:coproporphyrinogen III oxidase n=1 Tax=Stutzerimonas stutzeri TaxID=316 RepID=UPI00190CC7C2|nr:coproporphyrinogen III oxidase [Stutzerimonas stutzeri]MBK3867504.1 coproporphyrinogen III oxidase [Stutzerimonas stutzeri]